VGKWRRRKERKGNKRKERGGKEKQRGMLAKKCPIIIIKKSTTDFSISLR